MKFSVATLLLLLTSTAWGQSCDFHYTSNIKTIQVKSGLTWAYQEVGSRSKTPTLFIHGLGGNSSHWSQNQLPGIRVDFLGYGYSSALPDSISTEQTLTFLADQLSILLEHLSIPRCDVVGHSMGGQIAMWLSLRHPEKVRRLVLLAPAGLETFTAPERTFLKNFASPEFYANQNEAQVRQGFRMNFVQFPKTIEPLIQDRLHLMSCQSSYFQTLSRGVAGMLAQPVISQLGQIKQPTLILFGKQDQLIPNRYLHPKLTLEEVVQAAKAIPTNQIRLLDEMGHMLMFEKPMHIDTYIKTYLTKRKL